MICRRCNGRGQRPEDTKPCYECEGKGHKRIDPEALRTYFEEIREKFHKSR